MKQALETLLRELARAAAEDGAEYGVEVLDAVAAGWQVNGQEVILGLNAYIKR